MKSDHIPKVWGTQYFDTLMARQVDLDFGFGPPDYYTTEYPNRLCRWLRIFGRQVPHWNPRPIHFRKIDIGTAPYTAQALEG